MNFVQLKDPDADTDYSIDWDSGYLEPSETLTSSVWSFAPSGEMSEVSSSDDGKKAVIMVTGGIVGRLYRVSNQIQTSTGRKDDRSLLIRVDER